MAGEGLEKVCCLLSLLDELSKEGRDPHKVGDCVLEARGTTLDLGEAELGLVKAREGQVLVASEGGSERRELCGVLDCQLDVVCQALCE